MQHQKRDRGLRGRIPAERRGGSNRVVIKESKWSFPRRSPGTERSVLPAAEIPTRQAPVRKGEQGGEVAVILLRIVGKALRPQGSVFGLSIRRKHKNNKTQDKTTGLKRLRLGAGTSWRNGLKRLVVNYRGNRGRFECRCIGLKKKLPHKRAR